MRHVALMERDAHAAGDYTPTLVYIEGTIEFMEIAGFLTPEERTHIYGRVVLVPPDDEAWLSPTLYALTCAIRRLARDWGVP